MTIPASSSSSQSVVGRRNFPIGNTCSVSAAAATYNTLTVVLRLLVVEVYLHRKSQSAATPVFCIQLNPPFIGLEGQLTVEFNLVLIRSRLLEHGVCIDFRNEYFTVIVKRMIKQTIMLGNSRGYEKDRESHA